MQIIEKNSNLLSPKMPKKYKLSAFNKDKNNYYLFLSLFSKALLVILILLALKKVSNNLTLLVFT